MRRRFIVPILVLALVLSLFSCSKTMSGKESVSETLPMFDVYVCTGMDRYPAIKALLDKEALDRLEKMIGFRIELHVYDAETDSIDIASSGFSGILLADNPNYTVRLSNAKVIDKIDYIDVRRNLGTNNGEQYGYVFSGSLARKPVLLVDVDAFEKEGIIEIPYTIDSLYDALKKLQETYQVPLALCGNPTEAGFFVIQQMYGLSPLGGREFYVSDDGTVVYDKLSEKGFAYLEGLRKLFGESLIPSDMLILNEYGVMKMLLNNVSAAGVFTNMTYAMETVSRMISQGRRVAIASIPVDDSRIEFDIYKQLLGFVSKGYTDTKTAMAFFMALDEISSDFEFDISLDGINEYKLFQGDSNGYIEESDPIGDNFYAMIIYYKSELDLRFLIPYYGRIASGDYDLSRFDEMRDTWMASEISTNYEYIHGMALMRLFNQMIKKVE